MIASQNPDELGRSAKPLCQIDVFSTWGRVPTARVVVHKHDAVSSGSDGLPQYVPWGDRALGE